MVGFLNAHQGHFSPMLIFSIAVLVLAAFNYGFSDQAFASSQAMDAFARQFGHYEEKTHTYKDGPLFKSLYNSLKAGGQIFGVFIGSWVSDRWGRRMCIFIMSIYALGSISVIVSSQTDAQILAGRTLHYIYLGMELAVLPTTLAEIAPARFRGSMGVLYWLSIKVGGLVITCITRGTSKIQTNAAWRIPFGLIFVIPLVVAPLIWLTPESPRWLLLRDRREDAMVAFKRLQHKNTPPAEAQAEFDELVSRVALQLQKRGFRQLFTKANRMRTFIVIMLNFFQQASGQAFASQYGTLFVKELHTVDPFSVTVGTNAVDIAALIVCFLSSDTIGRRQLMLLSAVLQTGALMTMGGLGASHGGIHVKEGIVAMLLVFSFAWSVGWAPLTYVIGAELPAAPLRELTLQSAYTAKLLTEFAVTFSYPYMETANLPGHIDLGGRLGFIYGSLAAMAVGFAYFFIPETRRMELEDIDLAYQQQGTEDDPKAAPSTS